MTARSWKCPTRLTAAPKSFVMPGLVPGIHAGPTVHYTATTRIPAIDLCKGSAR